MYCKTLVLNKVIHTSRCCGQQLQLRMAVMTDADFNKYYEFFSENMSTYGNIKWLCHTIWTYYRLT